MSDVMNKERSDIETKSYRELHRPASEFATRSEYLDHELQIMKPRRFGLNLPGRDFRFELEDLVPALAGTIGIISMYSAVMMSWADGLTQAWDHINLGKEFAIEVARVEMLFPALFFCVIASGFLNPRWQPRSNDSSDWLYRSGRRTPSRTCYPPWRFRSFAQLFQRWIQTGQPHL